MSKLEICMENGITSVASEDNGIMTKKTIHIKDLISAFQSRAGYVSPLLPGNSGLMKYETVNNKGFYAYVTPPTKTTTKYGYVHEYDEDEDYEDNIETYDIITPYLLWFVATATRNGRLNPIGSRVFALKAPILSDRDQLYLAPFANVYSDEGNICWSGADFVLSQEKSIQSIFTQFFNGYGNNDLSDGKFTEFNYTESGNRAFKANHLLKEIDYRLYHGQSFEEVDALYQSILKPFHLNFSEEFASFKSYNL